MKVTVPVDNIDTLMTQEDFIKKVEECVNSENIRLLGTALLNITNANSIAVTRILEAVAMTKAIALDNPDLAKEINAKLVDATQILGQLTKHFETQIAVGEALHETKH